MANSVIVIGLGRFGTSIAHTLFQLGYDVLGIDTDEKVVQDNLGHITYSVQADATNEDTLRELGARNFDAAVVAVGSDMQSSLMSSVLLSTIGVPLIIARAENELHGSTLEKIGVHKIIYPEQESGEELAHSLFNENVIEYMDLTLDYGISKIKVPDHLIGSTLKDIGADEGLYFTALGLQGGATTDKGIAMIAIKRGKGMLLAPDQEEELQKGDILIVGAKDKQLEKFRLSGSEH